MKKNLIVFYSSSHPTSSHLKISIYPSIPTLRYCRHHHPVPLVKSEEFTLRVEGEGLKPTDFTLQELKEKFPAHKVTMTQQCAGNRRSELHRVRPTQGLLWAQGTISTGEFVGVRVRDVVESCLLNKDDNQSVDKALGKLGAKHVHFVAIDEPYAGRGNVAFLLFSSLSPHQSFPIPLLTSLLCSGTMLRFRCKKH